MHYVLRFTDPLAQRSEHSGRKGANLAGLTQNHLPVPTGFIVTTEAYRSFIAPEQRILASVTQWNFGLPEVIRKRSAELHANLTALELPTVVIAAVTEVLAEYSPQQAFAVRASPVVDDFLGSSFAGKYASYLNCHGSAAVLKHIKHCFISLWQDRAITYRNHHQLSQQEVTIAVVVQAMLNTEVAGVGFSVNPVNGELHQTVVDANYGLGHVLGDATHEADRWVLHKNSGEILSAHISKKTLQLTTTSSDGTIEEVLSDGQANMPCLTPHQLQNLNQLLVQIETQYGFPQEIEWGWCDGQFYCLQTRPITTLPPHWTRDEACARFPNVITPLAWDFINPLFHNSLHYSFHLMNYPPFQGQWFDVHDHYLYGNQNAVEIYTQGMPFKIKSLDDLKAHFPLLYENFRWMQELPNQYLYLLDNYLVNLGELAREPLLEKSQAELWQFINRVQHLGREYFRPNLAIYLTCDLLKAHLLQLLQCEFSKTESLCIFDKLLGNLETKSQEIENHLFKLARYLRAQPELSLLLQQTPSREIITRDLLAEFPKFSQQLQQFLKTHGHREIDLDPYHPTFIDAPWRVLDDLRLRVHSPLLDLAPMTEARLQQGEHALFLRLPLDLHFFFHEMIRLTQLYTRLADLVHYQTTRWIVPLRCGVLSLGKILQTQGIIHEASDVFFAHLLDLEDAVQRNSPRVWTQLAEHIEIEKQAYFEDKQQTPMWVLGGNHDEFSHKDNLSGSADSGGIIEGIVFLVRHVDDFALFPRGAILVTRNTYSAWMPLLYSAAAVVTEGGSPLSYSAIMARKLGIPAVSGIREAFNCLKTGMRVRVNGDRGFVEII
ncbi:MAG: hypothetical protein RL368_1099 [Pseudomonadota bacterium]|jgi:pyruvate,water dikinase